MAVFVAGWFFMVLIFYLLLCQSWPKHQPADTHASTDTVQQKGLTDNNKHRVTILFKCRFCFPEHTHVEFRHLAPARTKCRSIFRIHESQTSVSLQIFSDDPPPPTTTITTPHPLFSCTDYFAFALMHFGIQTKWTHGCFSALSTIVSIGRFFWPRVQREPFLVKFEASSIVVGPPFLQVWKTIYEMPDASKKEKTLCLLSNFSPQELNKRTSQRPDLPPVTVGTVRVVLIVLPKHPTLGSSSIIINHHHHHHYLHNPQSILLHIYSI